MSRRVLSLGLIMNQPANTETKYIPGSGVQMGGANNRAVRRALKRKANDADYPGEKEDKSGCACKLNNPSNLAFPFAGMN